jgi:hypothetical protein
MATTESVDLLSNPINTPIQSDVSSTKYPCTGFCYLVMENKEMIVSNYLCGLNKKYYELIKNLIIKAGDRKKNNQAIKEDGEYIDEQTIKSDFSEIVKKIQYQDENIVSNMAMENFSNNMYITLLNIPILGCLIINRSNETILLIKINNLNYLVIDSHQSKHGIVDHINAIKYITRNGLSMGVIQVGIYDPYKYKY